VCSNQFSSLPREKLLCYNRDPFSLAKQLFSSLFNSWRRQCEQSNRHGARPENSGGEMNVYETLYLRDDEMDEFGDSGAYGESLEENFEEEEEEEEAELPGVTGAEAETPMPPAPMPIGGGGGGGSSKPAAKKAVPKKAAPKKKAKKKAAKKAAKRKPARKAAKKKPTKKKPAKKAKKKAGKKSARRRR
jgi:hypothetical protein